MQAGLPPPFWTYAVRYFCLCYNTRTPAEGLSSWERRYGWSLMRYVPPPESRFRTAKTGAAMVPGIYLGYVHKAGEAGWTRQLCCPSETIG
eukprot:3753123-Pyramimonas_sp.AAC.1